MISNRPNKGRALAALLAIAAVACVVPARAASTREHRYVAGQALVRFEQDASKGARAQALASVEGRVLARMPEIAFELIGFDARLAVPEAVARLSRHDAVDIAEPNWTGSIAATPDDRCIGPCSVGATLSKQWAPAAVNAFAGWDVVPGRFLTSAQKKETSPIRIAVLDTKIETGLADWINREPLNPNQPYDAVNGGQLAMSLAADFIPASQQPGAHSYHASFVAGIAGAATNNTRDVAGIAYGADIVPITVVDGGGTTNAAALSQGILHAKNVGARVINLSLGIAQPSSTVQSAIDQAYRAGALVVAAAGNNANSNAFYPAWHSNVMAISASDEADRPGYCSNYSSRTSVAAPGAGVIGLDPRVGGNLSIVPCGTSTSTPHVSGLAALLFAQDPARTPAQVRSIIESTADDDRFFPGRDDHFGHGRINVERALRHGDGSPVVTSVRSTYPRAQGGPTTVTAFATVTSEQPLAGAEWFLDGIGAPGTGGAIQPADGTWGGRTETLTTDIHIGTNVSTGVHRLYVRAFDGQRWGPASSGVVVVDRTPARITDLKISPAGSIATPVEITFRLEDDFSVVAGYTIRATSQLTGAVAYESVPAQGPVAQTVVTSWTPAATDVGPHRIELFVTDEAVNPSKATGGTVVL